MTTIHAEPLVLELSPAQRERIDTIAGLLHTTPSDFVRMMVFSSLDSEADWDGFKEFAESYLDTHASGEASQDPKGSRLEDQAHAPRFRLLDETGE